MNIPQLVKKKILEIDETAEVILFGSRARGDFHAASDWDFLVLSDKEVSMEFRWKIVDALYEIEIDTENPISCIIRNKKNWKRHINLNLHQNIKREGVAV